ncbi:ABC transporter permease [Angustibacter sp. McL0619]|uniref:ABC transporter permease n=1 Tax=Angustibacter sp. McL0619 TaxID=3415676 RepID=UPI003CF4AAEE
MATTSLSRPSAAPAPVDAGPHPVIRVLEYFLVLMRRTFRGTLFGSFFSPLLYLVAMGYGLGSLVNSGGSSALDGVPYVEFIAPGVLVATAMQMGVFDASYPVLGSIKWGRQFHAMLATPVRVWDIVAGNLTAILLRSLLSGVVFLVVAAVLGAIPSWTGVFALVAVALVTLAYAGPMFAISSRAETDTTFNLVFRLGLVPMFLFSGTFFPVDQLPAWMQPVAFLIPLWHGSSLARDATLGTMSFWPDLVHVAYLLLWVVVGGYLAHRTLRRRMVV